MAEEIVAPDEQRPAIVNNWWAFENGAEYKSGFECPFFSDAHIPGEIATGLGPYEILNGLAGQEDFGVARQALVLRCGYYGKWDTLALSQTNDESYHGGSLTDEVAALLSVTLGVRLKPGAVNRLFIPGEDPKGRPFGHGFGRENGAPVLLTREARSIVPRALGTHDLGECELLKKLLVLPAKESIALVRAARYFQDGMWLTESEPALSWILFVSAIETAANRWREGDDDPEEKLREAKLQLVEYLEDVGGQELVARIASEFVRYMGSTKKFVDFLLTFRPEPPPIRPVLAYQLSWDNAPFKKAMSKIYDYRSRALHGGKPFPMPMCTPPFDWMSTGVPHEIIGHNTGMVGAAWSVADLPMHLHMFVYIVQGALMNWWRQMINDVKSL